MVVRVAVIGAGVMGADHARIVAQDLPCAKLQVICDTDEARVRRVADRLDVQDIAQDPEAVIARRDVDAVLIASPDGTHAPLSLACIAAGKPALCEKPLAATARECLSVIQAEIASGQRFLHVGFMRRFDPSYVEMKAALAGGQLGGAIMLHNFHRNVTAPANFTGSMAITNSAPHEFDIARDILGAEYTAITAFQPGTVDQHVAGAPVFMVLETDAGQLVTIEINNNAAYGYDVRGELVMQRGSISLNAPVLTHIHANLRASQAYPEDWRPRFAQAYRLQDKDWLDAVQSGRPSKIAAHAWDGYRTAQVAEAGVRALRDGQRITLSPETPPALYRRDHA